MANFKQYEAWVPGIRLPVDWPRPSPNATAPRAVIEVSLLASVLDASEGVNHCWTVRERTTIALMNELTDMPGWERKIFDIDFTFKWKSAQLMKGRDVTRSMADWCVEEVKSYVQPYYDLSLVPAVDGGVVKSDVRIPSILLQNIQKDLAAVRRDSFMNFPTTTGVISHVIDPFLCPWSWEAARFIPWDFALTPSDCLQRSSEGESQILRQPKKEQCVEEKGFRYRNNQAWSRRFQWLPFEVGFGNRGEGGPRVTSYINNVHPIRHEGFYKHLETLIDAAIPMLNQSLMESRAPHYQDVRLHVAVLEGTGCTISKDVREFKSAQQRTTTQFIDREGRWQNWLFVDLKKEFWSRGLQIVCEVQEYDLDPEHPKYDGDDWHVQGQRNEYVCASAIMIYSVHNIIQPQLSFRRWVWTEEAGIAYGSITEPPFAPEIYDAQIGDPCIQHIGNVALSEGRLVTFPNIWQTRLMPLELADKGKPGHVKILTLHLIDPKRRIISTSRVPPQRRDWWAQEVRRKNAVLWRLPKELWAQIVDAVEGYPLSRHESLKLRDEFVEERTEYQRKHTEAMMNNSEWYLGYDDDVE